MGYQTNAVMCLVVFHKQPRRHIHSKVWELHLQPLAGPVCEALYRHPLLLGHFQMGSDGATGAAEHTKCLPDIGPESHPAERPGEGVELPLQPIRVSKNDQAVVRVEKGDA